MPTKKARSRNGLTVELELVKAVSELRESMVALKQAIAILNGQAAARSRRPCTSRRRALSDARWNRA